MLTSAIWAGRNPGVPVNYNVNWTYGGDGSAPNGGFAALHGSVPHHTPAGILSGGLTRDAA